MIASLIMVLHLMGFITLQSATTSLYVAGVLLIIAELGVISFGLIAFNGLIALYAGYTLQSGNDLLFGVPVGWPVLFGIAFVEILVIIATICVYILLRKQKNIIGQTAMIGEKATVIEWNDKNGSVRFEGEIWEAKSTSSLNLNPDEEVTIQAINKLKLIITA